MEMTKSLIRMSRVNSSQKDVALGTYYDRRERRIEAYIGDADWLRSEEDEFKWRVENHD